MPIYTRAGDEGETSLFGGERVPKHAVRVELIGTIDELSAALGLAVSLLPDAQADVRRLLQRIQGELFIMGADVAATSASLTYTIPRVSAAQVAALERAIDTADTELPPLKEFILPGGTQAAAALHLSRAICRRAERVASALTTREPLNEQVLAYLNRLSDLLFTLARLSNRRAEVPDVPAKQSLP
jgi:cob(I)alamin adenosyltransferase